jgi:hypothetical protein
MCLDFLAFVPRQTSLIVSNRVSVCLFVVVFIFSINILASSA